MSDQETCGYCGGGKCRGGHAQVTIIGGVETVPPFWKPPYSQLEQRLAERTALIAKFRKLVAQHGWNTLASDTPEHIAYAEAVRLEQEGEK